MHYTIYLVWYILYSIEWLYTVRPAMGMWQVRVWRTAIQLGRACGPLSPSHWIL
jgi:hypothetical protein